MTRPPLPYEALKQLYYPKGIEIPYEELLWTTEWLNFRENIKWRDNFTCKECLKSNFRPKTEAEIANDQEVERALFFHLWNDQEDKRASQLLEIRLRQIPKVAWEEHVKLEVHHEYYIWKSLPWEYDPSALITLCDTCHEQIHFGIKRKVFTDSSLGDEKILSSCPRCQGSGYIAEYSHVSGGVCFKCWGYGGY